MDLRVLPYGVWDAERCVMTLVDGSLGTAREGDPCWGTDGAALMQETVWKVGDNKGRLMSWMTAPRRAESFLKVVLRGAGDHARRVLAEYEARADALVEQAGGLDGLQGSAQVMASVCALSGLELAIGPGGDARRALAREAEDCLVPFWAVGKLREDIVAGWRECSGAIQEGVDGPFGIGFAVEPSTGRAWMAGLAGQDSLGRIARFGAKAGLVIGFEESLRIAAMLLCVPFGPTIVVRSRLVGRALDLGSSVSDSVAAGAAS